MSICPSYLLSLGILCHTYHTDACLKETSVIYCDEEPYDHPEFGMFLFPRTQAGAEAFAQCPLGDFVNVQNRIEPIPGFEDQGRAFQAVNGGRRWCSSQRYVHHKNDNEEDEDYKAHIRGVWENHGTFSGCRTKASDELSSSVKVLKNVDPLDPVEVTLFSFSKSLPKFNVLKSEATVHGDYTAAETMIEALGGFVRELYRMGMYQDNAIMGIIKTCFDLLDELRLSITPKYRLTVGSPYVAMQTAGFPYKGGDTEERILNFTTHVEGLELSFPSGVFHQALEQNVTFPNLKITGFTDELHLNWHDNSSSSSHYWNGPPDHENNGTSERQLTAFIVDVYDGLNPSKNASIHNLGEQKFTYTYHPQSEDLIASNSWRCVFWDEAQKKWSSEGMTSRVSGNSVTCTSTHFSVFSVLIDPLPLPLPIPGMENYSTFQNSIHGNILSILSSIGSAVSIVGLTGVILTYALFRSLRRDRSNRILLNLSIALLLMHLMAISSNRDFWGGACLVPALLLQYFLHASLFWMMMEAQYLHALLISVFVKPEAKFLTKRLLIAWGTPGVILAICGSILPRAYSKGRGDNCVIDPTASFVLYYVGYLAPIVVILVINCVIFCRIFRVLYQQTARQKGLGMVVANKDPRNKVLRYPMLSPTQLKGSFTIMVLVGAGWVLGLLAIGPFEVFFKYLFCIVNGGQGLFIFLFRVAFHPQASKEWRRALFGVSLDSGAGSTLEGSTTSFTNVNLARNKKLEGGDIPVSHSPGFTSASNSVESSLTHSNPDASVLARTLANILRQTGNGGTKGGIGIEVSHF